MDRRRFLRVAAAAGILGIAGCNTTRSNPTTDPATTPTPTQTATHHSTESPTETPREHKDTIFVATDGSPSNPGTKEAPLATVQQAMERAQPGERVWVAQGEYTTGFRTVRNGSPDAPITVTGPKSAVIRRKVEIKHSHVHLTGLTITGLKEPNHPDKLSSYERGTLIFCGPPGDTDEYLKDIVIAPAAIGHVRRNLIGIVRCKNVEIGPFQVIGPAGAEYVIGDKKDHAGEIVYLGTPPSTYERENYPWTTLDRTRNVHIHHLDNSAGHPHSELVNAKLGTQDILVEYCTDAGGSQNNESGPSASVRFQSYKGTLRWCDLRNGEGYGIHIPDRGDYWVDHIEDPAIDPKKIGAGHAIYGNRVTGFGNYELVFDFTTPEEQDVICGNNFEKMYRRPPKGGEPVEGDASKNCSESVPKGEGVGHTGGDSPWA